MTLGYSLGLKVSPKGENMKKCIIIAHPWKGSFNHAIKDRLIKKINEKGYTVRVIDLYEDNFSPAISLNELKNYKEGQALDANVIRYQNILKEVDDLILIFPIWWYSMPAMIKGFVDKVMLKKFAYIESKTGLVGQLINIKKVTIITTSQAPTWYIKFIKGNFIDKILRRGIFKDLGIKKSSWINFPNIKTSTKINRANFLERLDVSN